MHDMRTGRSSRSSCEWVTVDSEKIQYVMAHFFEVQCADRQNCDVFLVDGVPAASMTFTDKMIDGSPVVESFHLNRELLLLHDAGPAMRLLLYRRYPTIDVARADDAHAFLVGP